MGAKWSSRAAYLSALFCIAAAGIAMLVAFDRTMHGGSTPTLVLVAWIAGGIQVAILIALGSIGMAFLARLERVNEAITQIVER